MALSGGGRRREKKQETWISQFVADRCFNWREPIKSLPYASFVCEKRYFVIATITAPTPRGARSEVKFWRETNIQNRKLVAKVTVMTKTFANNSIAA